jgi:hypothetical protein
MTLDPSFLFALPCSWLVVVDERVCEYRQSLHMARRFGWFAGVVIDGNFEDQGMILDTQNQCWQARDHALDHDLTHAFSPSSTT